jgi:hypothetical protein
MIPSTRFANGGCDAYAFIETPIRNEESIVSDRERRRELRESYEQTPPSAGVYRFVNTKNGKALIASTANLKSAESKLAFAKSTKTTGVMFRPMSEDIRQYGIDAFAFEILEILEQTPEMTAAHVSADLKTMEELWREQADPELLY